MGRRLGAARPRAVLLLVLYCGCEDSCGRDESSGCFELESCAADSECALGEICLSGLFGSTCVAERSCFSDAECQCGQTCRKRDGGGVEVSRSTCITNGCNGNELFCFGDPNTCNSGSAGSSSSSSAGGACAGPATLCESDDACCSDHCAGLVCLEPTTCGLEGEPCAFATQCCSGDCAGEVCTAPRCTPGAGPELLASGEHALELASDEGSIYWIGADGVRSVSKLGGEPTTLLAGAFGKCIAKSATSALHFCGSSGEIFRLDDGATAPTLVAQGTGSAWSLAINEAGVF